MNSTEVLRFVQMSDLHLEPNQEHQVAHFVPYQNFQKVIAAIADLQPQPDFIIVSGDLAHDKKPPVYDQVAESLKSLGLPLYWLPGNHDDPEIMQVMAEANQVFMPNHFQFKGIQFFLLDSVAKNRIDNYGEFSEEELSTFNEALRQNPQMPAVVLLHHHPLPTGFAWMDSSILRDSEKFLAIIKQNPQVKAVLFGHIHHILEKELGETQFMSAPSTAYQFKKEEHFAWSDAGPGFRYLEINAQGEINTQVHFVAQ